MQQLGSGTRDTSTVARLWNKGQSLQRNGQMKHQKRLIVIAAYLQLFAYEK